MLKSYFYYTNQTENVYNFKNCRGNFATIKNIILSISRIYLKYLKLCRVSLNILNKIDVETWKIEMNSCFTFSSKYMLVHLHLQYFQLIYENHRQC